MVCLIVHSGYLSTIKKKHNMRKNSETAI
jgi:hypothetical protein